MWLAGLAIVAGLAVLLWSADRFVAGAAAVSRLLGVPPLLVGLLVIGFGTSAPELLVSGLSAWQGNDGIALGNALGSNITNIGLILGVVAVMSPLTVNSGVVKRELPILIGVTVLALGLLYNGMLGRLEALILLAVLAGFVGFSIVTARRSREDTLAHDADTAGQGATMSLGKGVLWTVLGLVLLVASSRLLVWGAVEVAQALGISDLIIGLTIVAVGTSLPELASSISAVRKREHDLVLGNVVGSNIFNTLAVIGVAGLVSPLSVPRETLVRDWPIMAVMTVVLTLFCLARRGPGRINRLEGGALLLAWLAYTAWLALGAMA